MKFLLLIPAYFSLCFFSCSNKANADVSSMAKRFAEKECRAIQLREQRFALANQIRFTQDSLMKLKQSADTTVFAVRLKSLEAEKIELLAASRGLADSIKVELQTLLYDTLHDETERKAFNQALNSELERMGCKQ